jgi:protein ImuB
MVDDLRRLGFDCIGDLLSKPRAPLALRFGPELGRRLDQATGALNEPIDPVRPPDLIEVRRTFAEPIGAAETIARYTGKLVIVLCAALEAKGLGAKRLDLLLYRVDNRLEAIRVGTALPVRDVKRLTRLLCDKIETVDPGFGIEIMSLTATFAEPLAPKQVISSLTEAPEKDISDLLDTLANHVGEQRLRRRPTRVWGGPIIGRAPRVCYRIRNRSRPSHCFPITSP